MSHRVVAQDSRVASLVVCRCGRKIVAYGAVPENPLAPKPGAACLECVELTEEFRQQSPEIAKAIDRWKSE